jgi:hypothetical protein
LGDAPRKYWDIGKRCEYKRIDFSGGDSAAAGGILFNNFVEHRRTQFVFMFAALISLLFTAHTGGES